MKFLSDLKLILTLRCKDASRLLSAQCDHPLKLSEKIALRLHVFACRSCKRYQKQLRYFEYLFANLRKRLFSDSSLPRASKELRDKIIRAIRNQNKK